MELHISPAQTTTINPTLDTTVNPRRGTTNTPTNNRPYYSVDSLILRAVLLTVTSQNPSGKLSISTADTLKYYTHPTITPTANTLFLIRSIFGIELIETHYSKVELFLDSISMPQGSNIQNLLQCRPLVFNEMDRYSHIDTEVNIMDIIHCTHAGCIVSLRDRY